jgi:hypothetical protein
MVGLINGWPAEKLSQHSRSLPTIHRLGNPGILLPDLCFKCSKQVRLPPQDSQVDVTDQLLIHFGGEGDMSGDEDETGYAFDGVSWNSSFAQSSTSELGTFLLVVGRSGHVHGIMKPQGHLNAVWMISQGTVVIQFAEAFLNMFGVVVCALGLPICSRKLGKNPFIISLGPQAKPELGPSLLIQDRPVGRIHLATEQSPLLISPREEASAPVYLDLQPVDLNRGLRQTFFQLAPFGHGV